MAQQDGTVPHVQVAIIGAGFAGLGAAIRLRQAGFHDLLILERAADLGGTWRDNTYPGCACDVPSHLYSFSFAPNPDWSRRYASQPEILAYLRGVARRFGLLPLIRFGHELLEARWNNAEAHWELSTSQGLLTAQVLVSGHGPLVEPRWPQLPGLQRFAGEVMHSARWRHELDLRGRRVAVIGTGASAVQLVPAIQPIVGQLSVFQRSAPWIVPRPDHAESAWLRRLFRRLPLAQRLLRQAIFLRSELNALGFVNPHMEALARQLARAQLERQVPPGPLRAALTPNYRVGCKRILVSNDYYPALQAPNVALVTAPIREVTARGLLTADGREHPAEVIVCGTGYQVTPPPIAGRFRGADGRTLAQVWAGSPQAYRGSSVAGFPNLFLLVGPNTVLGHTSIVYMIEAQLQHLLAALTYLRREQLLALDVRPAAQAAYNRALQRVLARSVWNTGGCSSFYLDPQGNNSTLWPGFAARFRRLAARFEPADYVFRLSPRPLDAPLMR